EPKQTASTLDFHLDELSTRPGTELPPLAPAAEENTEPPMLEWEAPKFTPPPAKPSHTATASNEAWSGSSVVVEEPETTRITPVLTPVESAKVTSIHEAKPAVTGLDLD